MKINASSYLVGDTITVTIDGLTSHQIDNSARVGIYRPTDLLSTSPMNSTYVSSLRDLRTWKFNAPNTLGDYEIRVFTQYSYDLEQADLEQALYGRIPLSVTSHSANPGDLTLSKTVFSPGEAAIATLTGFGAGEIQHTAYAGIFKPSDLLENYAYGASTYISSLRDGKTWSFNVPFTPGEYEMRVFTSNDIETRTEAIFGIISFEVREGSSSDYRFTIVPGKELAVKRGKTSKVKVFATRRSGGQKTDAIKMVTFGSLDRSVAVVNSAGVVKGVGRGTTYIKVSYGKVIAKIKVKVS